ncbi:MAG: exonuclease [Actinobacteria bacterium HGW-Actinobacteria-10]|jgi:DNA polymerase-3 subunit epsilon|nr:MAG: exonuclease [Actinobacteria bacterium HGW-Actinobacteria-10]
MARTVLRTRIDSGVPTSRWIAIDFETATREKASACALGMAVIEDGCLVEVRDWLIQPPGNIFEMRNTRIHGIDEDMVAQEPEFDELWPEISGFLDDAVLLAHNAPFDMAVLRASIDRYGLEPLRAGYYCTVSMARKVWPRLPNHKLDCVCGHCGIELNHHDAASDAEGCARIALRCRRETGADTLEALVDRLGLSAGSL